MEYLDVLEKGYYYHIFNRGNNRENLFLEQDNYSYFLSLVSKHLISVADVLSYCLLKNHFHFLIQIKENTEIENSKLHQPFSNCFNAYTKAFNKKYGREGSLFKKNFRRERITDEEYLRNVILYIHLNPVKHGFTEDYQNYPFSSFKSLVSDKPTQLDRDFVVELFENKQNFIDSHDLRIIEKFEIEP